MTTIFTRNIIIFVLCALMAKYVIGMRIDTPPQRGNHPPYIAKIEDNRTSNKSRSFQRGVSSRWKDYAALSSSPQQATGFSEKGRDKYPRLAKKITIGKTTTEKYCLSAATGFPAKNNNFVGTVNIASQGKYVYNTKDLQLKQCYAKDAISLPNIISENKLVIKVSPEQSKIIDTRISKSSDVGYIVTGTALEEIQNTSGILKIKKSQLKSSQGGYYLLELPSGSGLNTYGEGFMSRIDKIRRFANM